MKWRWNNVICSLFIGWYFFPSLTHTWIKQFHFFVYKLKIVFLPLLDHTSLYRYNFPHLTFTIEFPFFIALFGIGVHGMESDFVFSTMDHILWTSCYGLFDALTVNCYKHNRFCCVLFFFCCEILFLFDFSIQRNHK